ncbi:MAG: hypothetical protein MJ252_23225 [archaeon]|nr:hypothetical protein [archaeon]
METESKEKINEAKEEDKEMRTDGNTNEEEEEEQYKKEDKGKKDKFAELEDIQNAIQEMTKKIESEKNVLQLAKERYAQSYAKYCELKGKPVPKTKEEKEKEKVEAQKARKKHKVSDRIVHKKLKEQILEDEQIKEKKKYRKAEVDAGMLTDHINLITLQNQELKEQVEQLRKEKKNAINLRNSIQEKNESVQEDIDTIRERNDKGIENCKKKDEEFQKTLYESKMINDEFVQARDYYEGEYHHLIEENILREKIAKQERQSKRDLQRALGYSKLPFKGGNQEEIKKKINALRNEEISDRTPILRELIKKWKEVNDSKHKMIDKYQKRSDGIKEIFDKLVVYFGVDGYDDLSVCVSKYLNQMNEINTYITDLDNQIIDLDFKKEVLQRKIGFLTEKKENNDNTKTDFNTTLSGNMNNLKEEIKEIKRNISNRRNFFCKLQPSTDSFLGYLGDKFISQYVPDLEHVQTDIPYHEKSVTNYIKNVEDYYKLIQMYDQEMKKKELFAGEDINKISSAFKYEIDFLKASNLTQGNFRSNILSDIKKDVGFPYMVRNSSMTYLSQVEGRDGLFNSTRGRLGTLKKITKREENNSALAVEDNNAKEINAKEEENKIIEEEKKIEEEEEKQGEDQRQEEAEKEAKEAEEEL